MTKLVQTQIDQNNFKFLSVELEHIYGLQALPAIHKDPFDRLLIAQANYEKLKLVSMDKVVHQYPVEIIG